LRWWQGLIAAVVTLLGVGLILWAESHDDWAQAWRVEIGAALALLGPLYLLEELLRSRVEELSSKLRESVQGYGLIRRLVPAGEARTDVLDALVAGVRDRATQGTFPSAEVARLVTGDPDMRAIALAAMQGRHDLIDETALIRSIRESESGFEQYHALRLALEGWSSLSPGARTKVIEAIDHDAAGPGYIATDPARADLAQRIKAL
jgi:hypothetical protein